MTGNYINIWFPVFNVEDSYQGIRQSYFLLREVMLKAGMSAADQNFVLRARARHFDIGTVSSEVKADALEEFDIELSESFEDLQVEDDPSDPLPIEPCIQSLLGTAKAILEFKP